MLALGRRDGMVALGSLHRALVREEDEGQTTERWEMVSDCGVLQLRGQRWERPRACCVSGP